METPAKIDFGADRFVAFIRTLVLIGYDFTAAAFALQVRDRKDGGAVRADLGTAASAAAEGVRLIFGGTATAAAHIAAGRLTQEQADQLGAAAGDNVLLSHLGIRINESTVEAMPFGTERGDDLPLYWDLHITPSGGIKDKYAGGDFTVRAGVTE